jgi:hypothetical protein
MRIGGCAAKNPKAPQSPFAPRSKAQQKTCNQLLISWSSGKSEGYMSSVAALLRRAVAIFHREAPYN